MNGFARLTLVIFLLLGQFGIADELGPPTVPRAYQTGPLTALDFQAPVPANPPRGIESLTDTDVQWKLDYSLRRERNAWLAELRRVQLYAMVRPDHCWNTTPDDPRLLNHGQGHFDLTQVFALEWQKRLLDEITDGVPMTGRGDTAKNAVAELEKKLTQRIEADRYLLRERHEQYDRETDHGRKLEALNQHRQQQRSRLRELMGKAASPRTDVTKPKKP